MMATCSYEEVSDYERIDRTNEQPNGMEGQVAEVETGSDMDLKELEVMVSMHSNDPTL